MSHGTPPGQRAPGNKSGRNKRKCEKYKLSGRREKNKQRRQEVRMHKLQRKREGREDEVRKAS